MNDAAVSVIVPNFNHARFLQQRIDSVLQQSVRARQIILLDDGSTDASRAVIEKYRGHPGVLISCNEQNQGSAFRQWNKGLALAREELVWIAESDDYARPAFLETLTRRLRERPTSGLVMCQSYLVDEAGREALPDWYQEGSLWAVDFDLPGPELGSRHGAAGNPIPNASAVVFRRSLAAGVGPVDERLRLCGDWDFWMRLLEHSDFSYVAQPLNCFRTHPASVRSSADRDGVAIEEHYRVAWAVSRRFEITRESRRAARWVMAHRWGQALWAKDRRVSWQCHWRVLRMACRFDPLIALRLAKVWRHLRRGGGAKRGGARAVADADG
jgi:glycosyltransferase involved in cell wall biosynthesis